VGLRFLTVANSHSLKPIPLNLMTPIRYFLAFILALLPQAALSAEENFQFFSGTTFQDGAQSYAFLVRQSSDSSVLTGRQILHRQVSGNFSQVGVMAPLTSTAILDSVLASLPPRFADTSALESTLNDLFGKLMPVASLTLSEKISGIIQVAKATPKVHQRLYFLSRTQPILGMCLGTVSVQAIPPTGATVFELRDNGTVVGRVTLDPANPPIIPAPTNVIEMLAKDSEDNTLTQSPKNDMSVKLRWETPDTLSRLSPITYGFNLYRLPKAFAESEKVVTTSPTPAQLAGYLATGNAKKVNRFPILSALPGQGFIIDNNDRYDGGLGFKDGQSFYYYAAAADLIQRPGTLSKPLFVTICDRMPPSAPMSVRVTNHFDSSDSTSSQRFEISWAASKRAHLDRPDNYVLYRWDQAVDIHGVRGATGTNTGITVAHNPATRRYSVIDDGPQAPGFNFDKGKTIWYTVRAVQDTACGPLESGDSSPGYGVIREREGPPVRANAMLIAQYCPQITDLATRVLKGPYLPESRISGAPSANAATVAVEITRLSEEIVSATLSLATSPDNFEAIVPRTIASRNFGTKPQVILGTRIPRQFFDQQKLFVTITDSRGKTVTNELALSDYGEPESALVIELTVDEERMEETINGSTPGGPFIHDPVIPNGTADLNPIQLGFVFQLPAREFKLYKRIDGGNLLLVEQGTDTTFPQGNIAIKDSDLPANAAEICYFLQTFDRHGNPSPMVNLGCVVTSQRVPLQMPMITDLRATGTETAPTFTVDFFCPPDGVDFFRVHIADGENITPTSLEPELTPARDDLFLFTFVDDVLTPIFSDKLAAGMQIQDDFYVPYQTGRIAGTLGNPADPGVFSVTFPAEMGPIYKVIVQPVTQTNHKGPLSSARTISWGLGNIAQPAETPWPARGPADTIRSRDFDARITADFIEGRTAEVGIRIGDLNWSDSIVPAEGTLGTNFNLTFSKDGPGIAPTNSFPLSVGYELEIFRDNQDQSIFPFVIYRYQVPSIKFPQVSNQVVQISPFIDRVRSIDDVANNRVNLYEPFLRLSNIPGQSVVPGRNYTKPIGLYARDTQGVVRGASYIYLLARFKENRELDRVLKTNSITIPE